MVMIFFRLLDLAPRPVNLPQFVDPALEDVGGVPPSQLCQFKESRSRLHVADLVATNREVPLPLCVGRIARGKHLEAMRER